MKEHWEAEKDAIAAIRELKEELEAKRARASSARPISRRRPRSATAGSPSSSGASRKPPRTSTRCRADQRMLKEEVDAEDIAEVVAQVDRRAGQPAHGGRDGRSSSGSRKFSTERVIGQDEAVTAVANAIRRSRAGLPIRTGRSAPSCSSDLPA